MHRASLVLLRSQAVGAHHRATSLATMQQMRHFGGCGGGGGDQGAAKPKKKGILELFKSVATKKPSDVVKERTLKDAHSRTLLGLNDDAEYQGHAHGEHARALEADLKAKLAEEEAVQHGHSHDGHGHSHNGHGHSHDGHGHSHDGHGHSHDGHGHSHDNAPRMFDEDPDDFVDMWNPNAPNGPEHGGPRGLEPTRYANEWEKKGRVSDFT